MRGRCVSGWEACSRKYISRSASRPRDRRERKKEEVSVRRAGKRGSRSTQEASTRGHAFCATKNNSTRIFFLAKSECCVFVRFACAWCSFSKRTVFACCAFCAFCLGGVRNCTRTGCWDYKLLRNTTMAECCDVVCCRRALAEALCEAFRGALAGTPASFESIKGFPFRCVCASSVLMTGACVRACVHACVRPRVPVCFGAPESRSGWSYFAALQAGMERHGTPDSRSR